MIPYNKLRALAPLCVALMLLPGGSLEANNRKGDRLCKLGVQAEAHKDYDKALQYFQQALDIDPKETTYDLAARRTRFEASQAHVEEGKKFLKADDYEKAYTAFQKAFATDPGSMVALQDMQQTKELMDQKQK